ncbi:MAG TPA: anhydro-N-acetylmuramic acid kinase [Burkholderiaceae bacterium]|jgi:anhydro-N-acetylmuramic acid kinase|nr:anhydro-N-acetylmuramic acid kinase [Burkholderiaceae bacterium]
MASSESLIIGLMSGTSMDGVDGVLADFGGDRPPRMLASCHIAFPESLRADLMALQASGDNEIHREALAANRLVELYAQCVHDLLRQTQLPATDIRAIGCHGQTIRHCPHLGYTRQSNNPALLAELTGINVIADFRSRDVAAGGQGAPLVPAFHQAVFGKEKTIRVLVNIGGMTNISVLDGVNDHVIGFDTGPGNVLMDLWIARHRNRPFDANGDWAASGVPIPELLDLLQREPFFALTPPKSTGRDLFDANWLAQRLSAFNTAASADIQATLTALTATTLATAIAKHAPGVEAIYVCGGGAFNAELLRHLQLALTANKVSASVQTSDALGISPNHVEALAFAWLAQRFDARRAGNLPDVTGASGLRILGAFYPA